VPTALSPSHSAIFNGKPNVDSWVSPSLEVNDTVMEVFSFPLGSHGIFCSDNNGGVLFIIMTQNRDDCKHSLTEAQSRFSWHGVHVMGYNRLGFLRRKQRMNHSEWIRTEFKNMSQELGFSLHSREEIDSRLARVRAFMRKKEIEALLVIQKMDYYYFSGTSQDALLFLPLEGLPLLLVHRELERAKVESPLDHVIAVKSMRDFPLLIKDHYGRLPANLGLELDVLPVKDYFRYQELLPSTRSWILHPSSAMFVRSNRHLRSASRERQGTISKRLYVDARSILKEGMTEIEFGSLLMPSPKGMAMKDC